MQLRHYPITGKFSGLLPALFCLILSCCTNPASETPGRKLIATVQERTPAYLLQLKFYTDHYVEVWENTSLQSTTIYQGTYTIRDSSMHLVFAGKNPGIIGDTLLFMRGGLRSPDNKVVLHYDKDYSSSPFEGAYQLNVYFAGEFDKAKLYGRWREAGAPEIFHHIYENCWIYEDAQQRPYDTTFFELSYDSPPMLEEKFKAPVLVRSWDGSVHVYSQVMHLDDSILQLLRFSNDGCQPTHADHQVFKRVR